jgi:hypothetical protein
MPKGALLHVHLDASVSVSFLLQLALKHRAVHVRTASALSPQSITSVLPEFRILPESEFTSLESLTDPSYPDNGWVPLKLARQNFAFGGEQGFDQWFQAAVTINPAEAYGTHKTVTKVGNIEFVGGLCSFHCFFAKICQKFTSTFVVIAVRHSVFIRSKALIVVRVWFDSSLFLLPTYESFCCLLSKTGFLTWNRGAFLSYRIS